jgi:hydroxyacylglutathione hydrolase
MPETTNPTIQVINLGFVNAFLLPAGEGYILVDTGVPQVWARLESALLSAGCLPDKLKLVVITHGDGDHTGNCLRLRNQYHARIAMHPADFPMVESGATPERTTRTLSGKIMIQLGKLFMKGASGQPGMESFTPDIALEDGQSLAEYGLDATVLHTPGHTPGSIVILTGDGLLLAGDTFTNNLHPGPAMFIQNPEALNASLERIKRLPARIVYPGHGKPFPFEKIAAMKT